VWVQTGLGIRSVMSLVTFAGRRTGLSVTFPGPSVLLAVPDARGYFLVQQGASVYDIRPGRRWRVVTGTLDAVGPSAWLVTRCSRGRCAYQVIDPADGAARPVPGPADRPGASGPTGVTSPDGLAAANVRPGHGGRWLVHLVNLVTGADRAVPVNVMEPVSPGAGAPRLVT
jgi:hypothetical protein